MDQNPSQQNSNFEESVIAVMNTLPAPIRSYLSSGAHTKAAERLMFKYRLRVDQAGVLERELALLIMGIESPDEFASALSGEAKMEESSVRALMQDVNQEVFVPLRQQMMGGTSPAPAPRPTIPAGIPQVSHSGSVASPAQPSHFHLENKIAPSAPQQSRPAVPAQPQLMQRPATPAPLPPRPNVPAPAHVAPLPPKTAMPRPLIAPPAPQRPMLPVGEGQSAPQQSVNVLRAPSPQPKPLPLPGRVPAPGGTLGDVLQSISRLAPPPPNLPGTTSAAPALTAPKPPEPSAPPVVSATPPPARPIPPPPPRKPGTDPYREPIE